MTLGQSIRKARGKVKLKELSALTGYSVTYLSDIQMDRTSPSVKALIAIAKALNVRPGAILDSIDDEELFDREAFANKILAAYDALKPD